ncbi:GNAT family N-acetyltransferase [Streptomyces sp. B-S-A8]|uniref:GNAT family N-acetyltransferase n=1 Tax=Streptomyces solicavernae TaxID=3043614 RepID=A0ABT6RKX3_9ACTN|nr:GNAT family N-acetyltransferase [Streptomyces sp. B-S-A8]MDI3384945.1 GNAT family N-acetyltransferase [Streptomyces sp. B-S-A8]
MNATNAMNPTNPTPDHSTTAPTAPTAAETAADFAVRVVRVEEWAAAKEIRLAALRDPLAPIAFMETREQAEARPEAFWKDRAARGAVGGPNRQFVAVSPKHPESRETPERSQRPGSGFAGTVTVIVEEPGTEDFMGERIIERQAHLVAVFVRPEHRGGRVAADLFRAAVGWARAQDGVRRVRLLVHVDNERALAFYRKAGFVRVRELGEECELEYRPRQDERG